LIDAIQLPKKIAIFKCAAHTHNTDPVSKENQKADEEAKKAAQNHNDNLPAITEEVILSITFSQTCRQFLL